MNGRIDDFHRIVVKAIPLIDVRAPKEFKAGALPQATNLPLLDDQQRHLVGLCYREKGQAAAVELGHQLVSGAARQARIDRWSAFLRRYPGAMLYCSRGGLRSQISQQWIEEATGITLPRLAGGYKALRGYLLDRLDPAHLTATPILLGGYTGSGKTRLLRRLGNGIDLEAIANHRGSSFGRQLSPQPGQADFENRLAAALITHSHQGHRCLVAEDEGRHVGKRYIPRNLANHLGSGDMVLLEAPVEERIQTIFDEYVVQAQLEYNNTFDGEQGLDKWLDDILDSVRRIGKRLGSQRLAQVQQLIQTAHRSQLQTTSPEMHMAWVRVLVCDYYDPMYDYQLKKKTTKPVFRGKTSEVLSYLRSRESGQS